jgi:hypothetical protein
MWARASSKNEFAVFNDHGGVRSRKTLNKFALVRAIAPVYDDHSVRAYYQ